MGIHHWDLIKPNIFRSEGKCFLCDLETSILLQVPSSDAELVAKMIEKSNSISELDDQINQNLINSEINNPKFLEILQTLKNRIGAFSRANMEKQRSFTEEILHDSILRDGLHELLLDTTNACNLACKYCIFSGKYKDFRSHSDGKMTFQVAKNAIDLYFRYLKEGELLNPQREPVIAFYGGEPLLNFRVIRFIVNYIKKKYMPEFDPHFTVTTNGTLLTEDIANFLLSNGFSIMISLDGPREEHDRNRVFRDGGGTFSAVIRNIEVAKDCARRLGFEEANIPIFALATYDFKTDLKRVKTFFDEESPIPLMFANNVRPLGTDYYSQFSNDDIEKFGKTDQELKEEYLRDIVNYGSDPSKKNTFLDILYGFPLMINYFRPLLRKPGFIPFTQQCIPGFKIHVSVDGVLHPCERAPTRIEIGNVIDGLDIKAIGDILRKYQDEALKNCPECSMGYFCGNCISTLGLAGDSVSCQNSMSWRRHLLEFMMRVLSANPAYFDQRFVSFSEFMNRIDFK